MSAKVEESYGYQVFAANATGAITHGSEGALGGFLCSTSGTLTLTETVGGATVVASMPVTAGIFHSMPFLVPRAAASFTVVLGGGASGTFAVN